MRERPRQPAGSLRSVRRARPETEATGLISENLVHQCYLIVREPLSLSFLRHPRSIPTLRGLALNRATVPEGTLKGRPGHESHWMNRDLALYRDIGNIGHDAASSLR